MPNVPNKDNSLKKNNSTISIVDISKTINEIGKKYFWQTIAIGIYSYFSLSITPPLEAENWSVYQISKAIPVFFVFLVGLGFAITALLHSPYKALTNGFLSIMGTIEYHLRLWMTVFAYFCVFIGYPCLFVQANADTLYKDHLAASHHDQFSPALHEVIIIGLSAGLLFLAYQLFKLKNSPPNIALSDSASEHHENHAHKSLLEITINDEITYERKMSTARHEAGHLLTYAAVIPLPEDLTANVFSEKQSGKYGYVRAKFDDVLNLEGVEWLLLCCLAGYRAECFFNDYFMTGVENDFDLWREYAEKYLKMKLKEEFFSTPQNEAQIQHNTRKKQLLLQKHKKILDHFFSINEEVLQETSNLLFEKETLRKSDYLPLLERVILPDDFPRVVLSRQQKSNSHH